MDCRNIGRGLQDDWRVLPEYWAGISLTENLRRELQMNIREKWMPKHWKLFRKMTGNDILLKLKSDTYSVEYER